MEDCTAVVLAAGAATRFPGKLMANFRNKPVVKWVVEIAEKAVGRVYIVVGHNSDEVAKTAGVPAIYNPWWKWGISTSVKAAIITLINSRRLVFMLGDMPLVKPETVRKICNACETGVVVPTYRGVRGNPVAVARDVYPQALLQLQNDVGMRALFNKIPTTYVEVDDAGILIDIDTPQDIIYAQLK